MANNQTKKVNEQKANETKQVQTVTTHTNKKVESVYTVDEFAKSPKELGEYSADIVRAALLKGGKESYTIEEAKIIVKKFSEKEVK